MKSIFKRSNLSIEPDEFYIDNLDICNIYYKKTYDMLTSCLMYDLSCIIVPIYKNGKNVNDFIKFPVSYFKYCDLLKFLK